MNNVLTKTETNQFRQTVAKSDQPVLAGMEGEKRKNVPEPFPPSIRPTPSADNCIHLDAARLRRAAWAFTTRRVPGEIARVAPASQACAPRAGDLVLARVDVLGHHSKLQLANGRRRQLFVGDEIVVAYGNRYASNQFEALIPDILEPCHLVAGGGIASRALSWHDRIEKGPTHITPISLLVDAGGERINLRDFAIAPADPLSGPHPATVAVVGTGMDSGKTHTAAYFVKGLIGAGLRAGYGKITGTGAGGDTWLLKDAGASPVLDFTDAGMATTYMASPEEVEVVLKTIVGNIAHDGVDVIVLEVADGVFQRETAALLRSSLFARIVSGIVFAARDAMGASSGVGWLRPQSPQVLALSGVLSAAPLQSREAEAAMALPVYTKEDLNTPGIAIELLGRARHCIGTRCPETSRVMSEQR